MERKGNIGSFQPGFDAERKGTDRDTVRRGGIKPSPIRKRLRAKRKSL